MNENNEFEKNEQEEMFENVNDTFETINNSDNGKKKKEFNLAHEIFEWVYTIAIALLIAFVIKGFLFDIVQVDGPSMFPTLVDGDRLIITKLGYKPEAGDIVILDSTYKNRLHYYEETASDSNQTPNWLYKMTHYLSLPKEYKTVYYVKRVIATEGQTVDIRDGKVYIDDQLLDEPYYEGITNVMDATVTFPLTVDEGYVFVMGDNRPNSLDSRSSHLGLVPKEAVVGKSQFRVWPLTEIGPTR